MSYQDLFSQGGAGLVSQPMAYDRYNDSLHEIAPTVQAANTGRVNGVLQPIGIIGGQHPNASMDENISPTLTNAMGAGGGHVPLINASMAVRRLTPKECERLQGFPDSYTAIPWKNKPSDQCPDGPRYKALGNSMAVPVMRWIGERIQAVEELMKEIKQ